MEHTMVRLIIEGRTLYPRTYPVVGQNGNVCRYHSIIESQIAVYDIIWFCMSVQDHFFKSLIVSVFATFAYQLTRELSLLWWSKANQTQDTICCDA